MSSDEERASGKVPNLGEKSVQHTPSIELYNNAEVTQDNGILSKLRRFEASMDAKFGVEAEAISRKLPEDKRPVPWHEQLSMALLWVSLLGKLVSRTLEVY